MVRVLSFTQLQVMDGMLQMRLILDGTALRYLLLCLADQGGETCPDEGMQRSHNAVAHGRPLLHLPTATDFQGLQGSEGTDLADKACSKTAPSWRAGRHRCPGRMRQQPHSTAEEAASGV